METKYIQRKSCIIVEDNGCGILQDEIDKLMELFYRVDKARNRAEGRTGLGLSLCRQIADLYDAEIQFFQKKIRGHKFLSVFDKSFTFWQLRIKQYQPIN